MRYFIFSLVAVAAFCFCTVPANAQIPDYIYASNIKNIKLHPYGNPLGYPILRLGSGDKLELHFDDMNGGVTTYYYTYQLCNADWTPALVNQFDFLKGYSQMQLTTYRSSSVALTRYTHYQAMLPESNCMPTRSGNYLLKVFVNGDTSQLIFTKRILIYQDAISIGAQIQQPFDGKYFYTHQKVSFKLNTKNVEVPNVLQQIKVCLLQNYRWDNAITGIKPTFIKQQELEYNTEEDCLFPGGKEWRWLDLRSLRLQSDRVDSATYSKTGTDVFVKTDLERSKQSFVFFRDQNGLYYNEEFSGLNPYWQGDYAKVFFTYRTPDGQPYADDLYLFGELTNYGMDPNARMTFNTEKGIYETSLFLKQGYYDYSYVTINPKDKRPTASFAITEGNYWDTENNYMILVYYRSFTSRADELYGLVQINSYSGRPRTNY